MQKKLNYNISKNIFYNHFVAFGNIYSGILIGISAPGLGTHWLGIISFIPLSLHLDSYHAKRISPFWKRALIFFTTCWLTGIIATSIACYWITNSIYIFGHLPWPVAFFITGVCYGLEVGIQLFVYFGIPLLIIKKLNNWDLPVRFSYILALAPWYPKLIQWNYGGLTFSEFPFIEQLGDLIGSSGLIIFNLGITFLAIGWLRKFNGMESNKKKIFRATIAYFLFCFLGLIYGAWRLYSLEENNTDFLVKTPELDILLVQPNFSLNNLASNPKLSYSNRKYNLENLIIDSRNGLKEFSKNNDSTKLVIWPESVFPEPFFKNNRSRQKVVDFAKNNKIQILFTTIDWEDTPNGKKFYGVSVLLDKKGKINGRYNKIFLIPFGEMIPFSSWFPKIASWLRKNIANMSEFHPGNEFKVFTISGGGKLSAPICFDIFAPVVIRKMVRNGSNLIINLSNLAWFGNTNASDNMVAFLRWRAIENRVPVVFASNNGRSVFIGANGKNLTKQLNLFEEGTLFSTLNLRSRFSFYREFAEWLWGAYILIFLVYCYLANRRGKIF